MAAPNACQGKALAEKAVNWSVARDDSKSLLARKQYPTKWFT